MEEHVGQQVEVVLRRPELGDPVINTLPNDQGEGESLFNLIGEPGHLQAGQGEDAIYGPCVTIYFTNLNKEVILEVPPTFDSIIMPGQLPLTNVHFFNPIDHYYIVVRSKKKRTVHDTPSKNLKQNVLARDNRRKLRDLLKGRFNKLPTGEVKTERIHANNKGLITLPDAVLSEIAEQTQWK